MSEEKNLQGKQAQFETWGWSQWNVNVIPCGIMIRAISGGTQNGLIQHIFVSTNARRSRLQAYK